MALMRYVLIVPTQSPGDPGITTSCRPLWAEPSVSPTKIHQKGPNRGASRGSKSWSRSAVQGDPAEAEMLFPPASTAPHLYRVESDSTQASPVRARPSRRWSPAPRAGQTPAARDVERARCCLLAGFVRLHLRSGGRGHFSTLHLAGYPRSRHNVGVRHGDDEPSHRRRGRLPRNDGQD